MSSGSPAKGKAKKAKKAKARAERVPGMRAGSTHLPERRAVRVVDGIISEELGWLFREQPVLDYGIDGHAEIVADDDLVSGQLLAIQIKGGHSWFSKPTDGGWHFYEDGDHLAYWLGHSLPVIVVIVDDDGSAYWEQVTSATTRDTSEGFALKIPRSQPLGLASRGQLLEVAGRSKGLAASLPDLCAVLPPGAAGALQRAAGADRLSAARLAERLAGGSAAPGATASLVTAARPSWMTETPAAQDLWLAVAGYAAEHGLPRQSGDAFGLAADSTGPRSALARALAGVQLISVDREASRALLLRARAEGQEAIADAGLTALDIPEDEAPAYDIPESVRNAPADAVDGDPFLLNFLAEAALRRRAYTEAVTLREKAVAAAGDGDSTYRLALANTLRRRALAEPGSSGADLRRALGYAQAAVAERRRWTGPSGEALGEVLDILTASGDLAAVITAALPQSAAGTALEAEAAEAGVARRGAHAALAARNRDAYDLLMQLLPDGPYRRELQAEDDEARGRPRDELTEAWTRLIADPADAAMTARCAAELARLGTWPPQADELRARSLLPENDYEALRAVYRAETGEHDIGIARLSELSDTTVLAAGELVHLLERHQGPDAAISEAERQAAHWQTPALQIQYVELLGRHGRFPAAVAFIERSIQDQSLPADLRARLCSWYVNHQARQGSFAAAAATARLGLEDTADAGLAWRLVHALLSDGRLIEARQALDRYQLDPVTEEEMRLYMQLHLAVPVSADAARVMTRMAGSLPDGEFRDAVIGLLIRETVIARSNGTYPDDLISAVDQLEAATAGRPGTGLRIDPNDDDALRAALEKKTPDLAVYQQLLSRVQRGIAPMADIASLAGQAYGSVLLHRPAGVLTAADLRPLIRAAGEAAARQAVETRACVADLSSLHLLALLDDDGRLRIRAALPAGSVIVARSAVDDALLTRDHVRNLSAGTYTASLAPDGTIDRTVLADTERALLLARAEALESAADAAQSRQPATTAGAAADAIAVARESKLPLWCDDIGLRQKARQARVDTFSLLDLITVLNAGGGAFDLPQTYRTMAGQFVADLPLDAADITALATDAAWQPGPAHAALARPAWWEHHEPGWRDVWLEVAAAARRHSPGALVTVTQAGVTGALAHVEPGYATQRYQQLAVQSLVACTVVGQPAPAGFLGDLARHALDDLAPDPRHVLTGLANALEQRGEADPVAVAMCLLPGVSLP